MLAGLPTTFPQLHDHLVRPHAERVFLPRRRAQDPRPVTFGALLDDVEALVVPVLASSFDLEASQAFLHDVGRLPKIKRGKLPVALVANRLKPWTNASQQGVEAMKELHFPLVAQLRDSTGYVVLAALGKSIFDYHSENVNSHQDDWAPLVRWLKKLA